MIFNMMKYLRHLAGGIFIFKHVKLRRNVLEALRQLFYDYHVFSLSFYI